MTVTSGNETSSVGLAWPPEPASNNRMKGFYSGFVSEPGILKEVHQELQCSFESGGQDLDRATVRFIGTQSMLAAALQEGMPVEAAMPLAGNASARWYIRH